MHTIRDCVASREVWEIVLLRYPQSHFFSQAFAREWIHEGLRMGETRKGCIGWKEIMAIVSWRLWRWRNEKVFDKGVQPLHERLEFIHKSAEETGLIWGREENNSNNRVLSFVSAQPTEEGLA